MENLKMEDYKVRVLVEHFELTGKLIKLDDFIKSEKFESMKNTEQGKLLIEQKDVMDKYLTILGKRLDIWLYD